MKGTRKVSEASNLLRVIPFFESIIKKIKDDIWPT
jgi:hypothetical protein